jgi:hypothetical protein
MGIYRLVRREGGEFGVSHHGLIDWFKLSSSAFFQLILIWININNIYKPRHLSILPSD